jgi:hypothetical protein
MDPAPAGQLLRLCMRQRFVLSGEKEESMLSVNGYYNGERIVMDEKVSLSAGQKVIITILDSTHEKKRDIDLDKYMGRGKKMFDTAEDIDRYIEELRSNDRV